MRLALNFRASGSLGTEYTNRKRNRQVLFCVSEEEWRLIRKKMILSKTRNMGAYLRKMAIDGYIINVDTSVLKEQIQEMNRIGVNINQIAKRVNSTNEFYQSDMEELKRRMDELWRILKSSQLKLP